jgi:uncharacterized membrane protein HdeD (DUF308 family)
MGALPSSAGSVLAAAIFLLLLAAISIVLACVPRWRKRFHWGRTGDAYPVSRTGCLGVALAFLIMAAGPAGAHLGYLKAPFGFLFVLAGFLVFVFAGVFDRYSERLR